MSEFTIDEHGWCTQAERIPSPNYDARPDGCAIDLLVIHNISLPPKQFGGPWISNFFQNQLDADAHPYFQKIAAIEVSSHFLIRRDGALIQYVSILDRAWHAGASSWQGRTRCNDFSIGVELEGADDIPFTGAQYQTLTTLSQTLLQHYPIKSIAGHSDIAPQRKTDPGPCFEWARYRAIVR